MQRQNDKYKNSILKKKYHKKLILIQIRKDKLFEEEKYDGRKKDAKETRRNFQIRTTRTLENKNTHTHTNIHVQKINTHTYQQLMPLS